MRAPPSPYDESRNRASGRIRPARGPMAARVAADYRGAVWELFAGMKAAIAAPAIAVIGQPAEDTGCDQ